MRFLIAISENEIEKKNNVNVTENTVLGGKAIFTIFHVLSARALRLAITNTIKIQIIIIK